MTQSEMPAALRKKLDALGVKTATPRAPRYLKTGSLVLDAAIGGIPIGRLTTISGASDTGKTTLALLLAANVLRAGGRVALFDAEMKYSLDWGSRLTFGGDNETDVFPVSSGENALNAIRALIQAKYYDLIIIDSIAAMTFEAQLNVQSGDNAPMMIAARMWAAFMGVIKYDLSQSDTALLAINQLRSSPNAYEPEYEPGGKAIQFQRTLALRMFAPNRKEDGVIVLRPTVFKNHNSTDESGNHQRETFDIRVVTNVPTPYIDKITEIVTLGKQFGIFTNKLGAPIVSGNWYFGGIEDINIVGKSKDDVADSLRADIELLEAAEEAVMRALTSSNLPSPTQETPAQQQDGLSDSIMETL